MSPWFRSASNQGSSSKPGPRTTPGLEGSSVVPSPRGTVALSGTQPDAENIRGRDFGHPNDLKLDFMYPDIKCF